MTDIPAGDQPQDQIGQIVDELSTANRLLFITGAGMSADSGLPTYRGVGGLYNHEETVDGLTIEECLSKAVFESRPELTWKYLGEIEKSARDASFNRGHRVIAEMESKFNVWVLTQNVDGFHLLAGSTQVIEIHGTMRRLRCTGCHRQLETDSYEGLLFPPKCGSCQGMLRPDVVLFDEMLPPAAIQQYEIALQKPFDMIFSVGTTSAFPYIASPVIAARRDGVTSVEINPSQTTVTDYVDFKLEMGAATALDSIWTRFQATNA